MRGIWIAILICLLAACETQPPDPSAFRSVNSEAPPPTLTILHDDPEAAPVRLFSGPVCVYEIAAIGLEYDPVRPGFANVAIVTGKRDGELGFGCAGVAANAWTGRAALGQIQFDEPDDRDAFRLAIDVTVEVHGAGCRAARSSNALSLATDASATMSGDRRVIVDIVKGEYRTSYAPGDYSVTNRLLGAKCGVCISHADFGRAAAPGVFVVCEPARLPTGPTQARAPIVTVLVNRTLVATSE